MTFGDSEKIVKNKYFVRSESDELYIISPTSKERVMQSSTSNLLDTSKLGGHLANRIIQLNDSVLTVS